MPLANRPAGRARLFSLATLALLGSLAAGLPALARAGSRVAVFVAPFDLFDTAADQRPAVLAAQTKWLRAASSRLRADLDASGSAHVVDTPLSRRLARSLQAEYAHPSTCPECLAAAARKSGARYVFVGTLHKVSDLIIYMKGYLLDASDGRQVMGETLEVKADNRRMLDRAADRMAHAIERHLS